MIKEPDKLKKAIIIIKDSTRRATHFSALIDLNKNSCCSNLVLTVKESPTRD
jgi:hypothetical protein